MQKYLKRIAMISLMTAIISVCSWLTIPAFLGLVPFTMQTFAVFCAVTLLGGQDGLISVVLYILIGLIGVPVFSGFKSGPETLFGPTGGYIMGFVLIAVLYWIFEKAIKKRPYLNYAVLFAGLILCYATGTVWFAFSAFGKSMAVTKILSICVIPFIIPDILKMVLAINVCTRVRKAIKY